MLHDCSCQGGWHCAEVLFWSNPVGRGCNVGIGQWLLASHTNLSAGFLTLRRAASWGAMGLLLAAPEGRNYWEGDAGLVAGIFPAWWPRNSRVLLPSS